jgi:carnitine O-acetyltransferase
MTSSDSKENKLTLLKKAIESHKTYMSDAVSGKAIDRHMLGLRVLAAEEKIQLPAFFSDPVYKASSTWRLSTSNITQNGLVAGYGPAVEDGYGVCYGTRKDFLHFSVSTRHSNKTTSTPKMKEALVQSLAEMQSLFPQQPAAKL